jgi:hypothetical protein
MSGEVAVRADAPALVVTDTTAIALPQLVIDAGRAAGERFREFFAAQLANDQTREAFGRAAGQWCEAGGLASAPWRRSMSPPISARAAGPCRRSSSTSPRSACGAIGSSSR